MELYTIGHSNLSIDAFIQLLHQYQITAIADVRSHPYSRYLPHFNQGNLQAKLEQQNIKYVFLGQELGARPNNSDCYVNGKALYAKIATTPEFSQGIKRLIAGLNSYKLALMCAEKDPIHCHRAVLICQKLREKNLDIFHILPQGKLETHDNFEERLLKLHNLIEDFNELNICDYLNHSGENKKELIRQAYNCQGVKIAYQTKKKN